jgi:pseudouridine-5'-phosphate glycosidase
MHQMLQQSTEPAYTRAAMRPALFLHIHPNVQDALDEGRPVVALESAVISHGLPWPDNLELARDMEAAVRSGGAEPATIALLAGRVRVGLDEREMEHLARASDVWKISRRDLPVAVVQRKDGGTTVAGTILIAHQAGIRVMATGGIGGVHRGDPADVSADLPEIARTPIVVVCSGAKAILDLRATLEWLETWGVPVVGYQTDELPAFYSRESGLQLEARVEAPGEVAAIVRVMRDAGYPGELLLCVPCPAEAARPAEEMEEAIAQAVREAEARGIHGKALTPFLLARVAELTEGKSQAANLALLLNNAWVAAQVAVALGRG